MSANSCSLLVVLRGVPVSRCSFVGVGVTSTSTGSMAPCAGGSTMQEKSTLTTKFGNVSHPCVTAVAYQRSAGVRIAQWLERRTHD